MVTLGVSSVVYTGAPVTAQDLALTVQDGDVALNYTAVCTNNIAKGTGKVTVTATGQAKDGMPYYYGSVTKTFKITAASLSDAVVTPAQPEQGAYYYTGKAWKPAVTVTLGGKTLVQGTDYTVSYKNNTKVTGADPKTAPTITVTGKGNYSGKAYGSFTIAAMPLALCRAVVTGKAYTGKALAPAVKVYDPYGNVVKTTEYVYDKTKHTDRGEYAVAITPKGKTGNYTGAVTGYFTIGENIAKATVEGVVSALRYTGDPVVQDESRLGVYLGGRMLTPGTDYTVRYEKNLSKGTAKLIIEGRGAYAGTVTKTFKILAGSLADNDIKVTVTADRVTADGRAQAVYTGAVLKPAVTVTAGGRVLVPGVDYTVAYKNNKAVGLATVTVTGKGNYTGTNGADFVIAP